MTDPHAVTPPFELVKEWWRDAQASSDPELVYWVNDVATRAARWGARQMESKPNGRPL